jgi:hypothetical protein
MSDEAPTPLYWKTAAGAVWAEEQDHILERYEGRWIVAEEGRLVAVADTEDEVRQTAAALLGGRPEELAVNFLVRNDLLTDPNLDDLFTNAHLPSPVSDSHPIPEPDANDPLGTAAPGR